MQVLVVEGTKTAKLSGAGVGLRKAVEIILLLLAAAFLCLHAVHLRADFPNHSPWMDWAKYTDEGWYGDAAIRHFDRGDWYVRGDFNPAAALPVWPLAEALVFRFTGVGLVPARALSVTVFALTLVCAYALMRWRGLVGDTSESEGNGHRPSLAPAVGVLMLAVSPFCYVFSRLAILEPMLNLLMMIALLLASGLGSTGASRRSKQRKTLLVALGVVFPLLVLTKTTAVFLFPAVLWMVWANLGYEVRGGLRALGIIGGVGLLVWLGYYGLVVRPHYLEDYRYLFSANAYTGITSANVITVLRDTLLNGRWIGRVLYSTALIAGCITVLWWWRFLSEPVIASLLLWAGGYAAFLAYHANLQPRYYLVIAVPLTLVLPLILERAWETSSGDHAIWRWLWRTSVTLGGFAMAIAALRDARATIGYVEHPEYTFVNAAEQIQKIIRADPRHSSLLLSISGSDLSLMTGLPSICDDFGTMELEDRVAAYQPGWYATWNQVDDDKMDALAPVYHLERVAEFPAMDDPDRNLLILYRLDSGTSARGSKRRHRRPLPRTLVTRIGQQPSAAQLEH